MCQDSKREEEVLDSVWNYDAGRYIKILYTEQNLRLQSPCIFWNIVIPIDHIIKPNNPKKIRDIEWVKNTLTGKHQLHSRNIDYNSGSPIGAISTSPTL